MHIEWSDVAFEDIENIRDYIAKDTPFYADQFTSRLMLATDKLADFPDIGRQVPEVGNGDGNIRELIYHSYRIIYRVNRLKESVLIITVLHGSRDITQWESKPWEII